MLVGVHERQLDDKGRLALPSAFRDDLDERCYLVLGEDRCINVYSPRSRSKPPLATSPTASVRASCR